MSIELLKKIDKDALWIDTTGTGCAVADYLEAAGIKVNRFTILNQSKLQQRLSCVSHANQE